MRLRHLVDPGEQCGLFGVLAVQRVERDFRESRGVLGALGVAAEPEQVLCCPARDALLFAALGDQRGREPRHLQRAAVDRIVGQRPDVGAAAAAVHRGDLLVRGRDARHAARQHAPGAHAVGDREHAQHDRSGLDLRTARVPGRQLRHRQIRLHGDALAVGLDAVAPARKLGRIKRRRAHRLERQRAVEAVCGRLEHLLRKPGQHRLRGRPLAAPPCGERRQREFFAEQMARKPRQKTEQRGRLQKRRARRVRHHHALGTDRLQQPRHAERRVRTQFERVEVFVVDPFDHAVHRLQSAQGLQVQPLVAHRQIAAFDQRQAEVARQIGVFEPCGAVRPGRQQHDLRLVLAAARGAQPLQMVGERAVSRGQMLHRQRIERARKQPRDDQAVLQQITQAGGRLRALRDHAPAAVRRACQIERGNVQMHVAAQCDAVHGAQITRVPLHQCGWQQRALQQFARAVDIGQHPVQQPHALQHAGFDHAPVLRADDQRKQVQRPGPLRLVRLGQHVVGHAVVSQLALQLPHPRIQPDAAAGVAELLDKVLPAGGQHIAVVVRRGAAAQLVEVTGCGGGRLLPDRTRRRRLGRLARVPHRRGGADR